MKLKNKAFTLVELIIVITILAILATISFISFSSYTKNSRDSNRLATLRNIQNGLDVYFTKNNTLPQPENFITISYSGETISYQGNFGDNNASLVGFSKTPLDPLDSDKYTYSTSYDLKKYQVLTLLESPSSLALGNLKTFAADDYSLRIPKTLGNGIGILLGTGSEANKPINFKYNASTFTGVNIATNTGFVAIVNDNKNLTGDNLSIIKNIGKNGFDSSLIGYRDMETYYISGTLNYFKDLSGNGVDCDSISLNQITNGKKGKAISLTGSQYNGGVNNFIKCLNLNLKGGSDFSLILSYRIDSLVGNIPTNAGVDNIALLNGNSSGIVGILKAGDNSYRYSLGVGINEYNFYHKLNGQTGFNEKLTDTVNLSNWIVTTLIYDSSNKTIKIFDNGEEIKYFYVNPYTDNPGIYLGLSNYGGITYGGSVTYDEMKIYNRALTNSEVKNIANSLK